MTTMKKLLFLLLLYFAQQATAQELYVFSNPASNVPAASLTLKNGSMFNRSIHTDKIVQRHMPEVMLGLNKNLMVSANATFSNMHSSKKVDFESWRLYVKYRFLSKDELHKHFRMAVFAAGSYSNNHLDHNEINFMGDQSGIQAGIIATQLWHKLAVSGTVSYNEVLQDREWKKDPLGLYAYSALNYSLSAGYLLFPKEYKDYRQTNFNIYCELLGSRLLDFNKEKYYIDLAPAVQFIFNSKAKLNLGYRFQLAGDIYRLSKRMYYVSYEHTFLGLLKK